MGRDKRDATIDYFWKALGLSPLPEYRFHPTRRWRFDWAWPDKWIAVEQEGGIWTGGRHTRGYGYSADLEKYNEAARLGWRIFRFQPRDFKKGIAQAYMANVFRISVKPVWAKGDPVNER